MEFHFPLFSSWPVLCQTTHLSNHLPHGCTVSVSLCTFSDVAHAVLDRCMTDNVTEDNPDIMSSKDYKVTFNFEFIEDWRTSTRLKRSLNRNNRNLTNTNIADYFSSPMHAYTTASTLSPRDKEKQSDTHSLEREEEQATKWKPEGFFKQHHPLNLMVGVAILFL